MGTIKNAARNPECIRPRRATSGISAGSIRQQLIHYDWWRTHFYRNWQLPAAPRRRIQIHPFDFFPLTISKRKTYGSCTENEAPRQSDREPHSHN